MWVAPHVIQIELLLWPLGNPVKSVISETFHVSLGSWLLHLQLHMLKFNLSYDAHILSISQIKPILVHTDTILDINATLVTFTSQKPKIFRLNCKRLLPMSETLLINASNALTEQLCQLPGGIVYDKDSASTASWFPKSKHLKGRLGPRVSDVTFF